MSEAAASGAAPALDAIARFAGTRRALILASIWAAGEAIVLPVVPDVLVALLALAAPRRAGTLFLGVLAGALAGSLVLAALTVAAPDGVDAMLRSIPGIDDATIAAAADAVAANGPAGFAQVGPGVPLKVYAIEWTAMGGGAAGLIAGVVINRLTRVGPVVLAAALAGWLAPGWLRRHEWLVLAGYAIAWIALYAALYLL